jgi:glycosidase
MSLTLRVGFLLCLSVALLGQDPSIYNDDPMQKLPLGMEHAEYVIRQATGLTEVTPRVEPPNWWTGLVEPTVEVMIYDRNVASYTSATVDHPGVTVASVEREENPNYLFVTLHLAPGTAAGSFGIQLGGPEGNRTYDYRIEEHPRDSQGRQKLSSEDFMYLIMPDRFANGDPMNDSVTGMAQVGVNRDKVFFRHGGDLRGVIDRLDYLKDLGITAIWLNPVLENDQPYESYHGYAISDHYRVDRRFGTNETYRELVRAAHDRGIKVIMDVIFNHVGDQHYLIKDLPGTDWIHQWPEYTQTTYRATTLLDPHVTDYDRRLMTDGWFDKHMPDLNQDNDHLANYLIQNSIWWTLYSGQDGFRIDTYAYPDPVFMARWNERLLAEFPKLGIFGETWVHGPAVQAWFTEGRHLHPDFNTHLPGVTDFQLYYAINDALNNEPGWTDGVLKLYYTLAQDYLYQDPSRNVIFLDNHDLARLFTVLNEDVDRMKSALSLLLTLRGIPMINYGTELGFTGAGGSFGEGGRVDFPGGFAGDERNLFTEDDRSDRERDIFNHLKILANYRLTSDALRQGDLTQFIPRDGVYVYFRHQDDEQVMVVFNGNGSEKTGIDLSGYGERLDGYRRGVDVLSGNTITLDRLDLAAKEVRVIELRR